MTKLERERIEAELEKQNTRFDGLADRALDTAKASKWTGLYLIGPVAVIAALVVWIIFF